MQTSSPSYALPLLHVLFWTGYVALEYVANLYHISTGQHGFFLLTTLLSLPVLILPTYFIVWFAVPKLLKKDRWIAFLLVLLGVAVLVGMMRSKWYEGVYFLEVDVHFKMPLSKIWKNVIRDYSVIALAVCIYIIGDWRKKQQLNESLIRANSQAELHLLKTQLQPHFLFNTLNNLYSLALIQSEQTATSILKLTELLDYLVYWANKDQVPLAKEIQLLHNYLDLERLRHGEELQVQSHFAIENDAVMVSPLLFLPFLENCFKHGGKGQDRVFWINISVEAGEQLIFHMENSRPFPARQGGKGGGVGLENLQQRLALLYPNQHSLHTVSQPDRFVVHLALNLSHA